MTKNHRIEAFKVSESTAKEFDEAAEKTEMKKTDLSRLLFNRALKELKSQAQKVGWENLEFSVREFK